MSSHRRKNDRLAEDACSDSNVQRLLAEALGQADLELMQAYQTLALAEAELKYREARREATGLLVQDG